MSLVACPLDLRETEVDRIVTLLRVGIHDVYKIVVILFAFLHFTSYSVFFLADKVGRRLRESFNHL